MLFAVSSYVASIIGLAVEDQICMYVHVPLTYMNSVINQMSFKANTCIYITGV